MAEEFKKINIKITKSMMNSYLEQFIDEEIMDEKTESTYNKYKLVLTKFIDFIENEEVTKKDMIAYKKKMTLKDLIMTLVPSGMLFILSKDEEPLQTIKAIDATVIEEELLNKEVLSVAPTYTLDGNKILGCLMIKINFKFVKKEV